MESLSSRSFTVQSPSKYFMWFLLFFSNGLFEQLEIVTRGKWYLSQLMTNLVVFEAFHSTVGSTRDHSSTSQLAYWIVIKLQNISFSTRMEWNTMGSKANRIGWLQRLRGIIYAWASDFEFLPWFFAFFRVFGALSLQAFMLLNNYYVTILPSPAHPILGIAHYLIYYRPFLNQRHFSVECLIPVKSIRGCVFSEMTLLGKPNAWHAHKNPWKSQ